MNDVLMKFDSIRIGNLYGKQVPQILKIKKDRHFKKFWCEEMRYYQRLCPPLNYNIIYIL